jgi:hypothetical protein
MSSFFSLPIQDEAPFDLVIQSLGAVSSVWESWLLGFGVSNAASKAEVKGLELDLLGIHYFIRSVLCL